jgi:L-ascorbate oxidase
MNTLARGALSAAVFASALILAIAPSSAAPRIVTNPATFTPENEAVTKMVPAQAAVKDKKGRLLRAAKPTTFIAITPPGEQTYNLNIVYTRSTLYNPNTGRDDPVNLRSYQSVHGNPGAPYVAPTIETNPGDTVTVNVTNALPSPDPSCAVADMNIPHCFNTTNLHTHGLWISPSGNSDNVLLELPPGGKPFQYEFKIPPEHPAGTFWYHPHNHGSTALQVSSGMVGALIIHGSRLPTPQKNGDIDTLLYNLDGKPFTERVLVLQQIQYACVDGQGRIKVHYRLGQDGQPIIGPNGKYIVTDWYCDPGDTGSIEFYFDKTPPLPNPTGGPYGFGPGNWASSARFTSINGLVLPTFEAKTGVIERWRMIHAGVRDTIIPQFFPVKAGKTLDLDNVKAVDQARIIAEDCDTTNAIPYGLFADDGLTMSSVQYKPQVVLQPGYRSDALVVFPKAGDYCVINAQVSAASSASLEAAATRLLGKVHVTGPGDIADVRSYVRNALVTSARAFMPPDVREAVVNDLNQGLLLSKFTPHPTITAAEVGQNRQYLTFNIQTVNNASVFQVGSKPWTDPDQDLQPYKRDRMDRRLKVGTADQWEMRSLLASHPFHIHVNPFQVVAILDPNGKDVSAPGAVDDYDTKNPPDPQYPGLKDQWKDSLWVKNVGGGAYKIIVRTRYERYLGEFVLHCHILDHEDQGMMQNVMIGQANGMSPGDPHGGGMKPGDMDQMDEEFH